MGFVSTKIQLSKMILPRLRKHSDDTGSTAPLNEHDADVDPFPLMAIDRQNFPRDGAYNFDLLEAEMDAIKVELATVFPIPLLPAFSVEPSYMKNPFRLTPSSDEASTASYRWYMGESSNARRGERGETVDDEFQPFFTIGIHVNDEDENMNAGADVSLLHGSSSRSLFAKFSSPPPSSSLSPRITSKVKNLGERAYLMNESALSNDWCERQLAFDLEVVDDDEPSLIDEPPLWSHQPDGDIAFEPPAIFVFEEALAFDEAPLFEGGPVFEETPLLQMPPLSPSREAARAVNPKQQRKLYERMVMDIRDSRQSIDFYNRKQSTHRRSSRRSSRRRGGNTVLRGSQFSPILSTVTERPSEEDASHCQTPRNNAQRSEFFMSSRLSEEDTAETCSSKESL